MVFLTSIIIIAIVYYLQADGLIYATIVAVIAELLNLFMSSTLTKSVEKKINNKWTKIVNGYKGKLDAKSRTVKEFETVQEKTISKLNKANQLIKAYREKYGEIELPKPAGNGDTSGEISDHPEINGQNNSTDDLPCGSDAFKKKK